MHLEKKRKKEKISSKKKKKWNKNEGKEREILPSIPSNTIGKAKEDTTNTPIKSNKLPLPTLIISILQLLKNIF